MSQETAEFRSWMTFERDEADVYLWRTGLSKVKKKGMTICYTL